jgi:hypothetical protein
MEDREIAQLTGHSSLKSLDSYNNLSLTKQRQISATLLSHGQFSHHPIGLLVPSQVLQKKCQLQSPILNQQSQLCQKSHLIRLKPCKILISIFHSNFDSLVRFLLNKILI